MSKLAPVDKCVYCRYHENGACFHPEIICKGYGKWIGRCSQSFPSWCPLPDAPEEDKEKEKT